MLRATPPNAAAANFSLAAADNGKSRRRASLSFGSFAAKGQVIERNKVIKNRVHFNLYSLNNFNNKIGWQRLYLTITGHVHTHRI
jgi:hypothetical protein